MGAKHKLTLSSSVKQKRIVSFIPRKKTVTNLLKDCMLVSNTGLYIWLLFSELEKSKTQLGGGKSTVVIFFFTT